MSEKKSKRWQTGINWGTEKNEIQFREGFARWREEGNDGNTKDYILWLMDRCDLVKNDVGIQENMKKLGIADEIDINYRLNGAEDCLFLSIADLIRQMKAKAQSEVKDELTRLREKVDFLQKEVLQANFKTAKLETNLKESHDIAWKDSKTICELKAELTKKAEELADAQIRIATLEAVAEVSEKSLNDLREAMRIIRSYQNLV